MSDLIAQNGKKKSTKHITCCLCTTTTAKHKWKSYNKRVMWQEEIIVKITSAWNEEEQHENYVLVMASSFLFYEIYAAYGSGSGVPFAKPERIGRG